MTLGKPARTLLAWLARQGRPVTQAALESAPCYSDARKRELLKAGLIMREQWGEGYAYSITDKGRAVLETDTMALSSARRSKIALVVSVVAILLSAFSLYLQFFGP